MAFRATAWAYNWNVNSHGSYSISHVYAAVAVISRFRRSVRFTTPHLLSPCSIVCIRRSTRMFLQKPVLEELDEARGCGQQDFHCCCSWGKEKELQEKPATEEEEENLNSSHNKTPQILNLVSIGTKRKSDASISQASPLAPRSYAPLEPFTRKSLVCCSLGFGCICILRGRASYAPGTKPSWERKASFTGTREEYCGHLDVESSSTYTPGHFVGGYEGHV
jgi:hypothetical protein